MLYTVREHAFQPIRARVIPWLYYKYFIIVIIYLNLHILNILFVLKLSLSTHDSATPVRLVHNTTAHLLGPSRTIGAVIVGCSGVRNFVPNPVSKLIECIGGMSALLGLVAMATDVEGLYASVKALSCILRSNPSARMEMERIRGYQV